MPLTYPLFGLAVIFPLNSFIGSLLGNTTIYFGAELTLRLYYASYIVSTLLLKEFTKRFLLEEELKIPFSLTFFTRMSGIIATVCFLTLPVFQHSVINGVWFTALNSMGVVVISVQLIIALYSLFILENTYRFAQEYQRRIARLCFLALAVIIVFQLFFSGYLLLYKTISEKMIYLATVVYGVTGQRLQIHRGPDAILSVKLAAQRPGCL